jgi:hypothetical protein
VIRRRATPKETTPWAEQEISDLTNYWKLGMSMSEISEKIATRSIGAIASKIKRLRENKNLTEKPEARRHGG